jgi:carbon-monoxide dehydrogenase iron sulfur subunit
MIFNTENCTGCRTCEIACSFHHSNSFAPDTASIKIINKPEEQAFSIRLYEQNNGNHIACDGCAQLDEPFCVKYCPPVMRDELIGLLKNFKVKSASSK